MLSLKWNTCIFHERRGRVSCALPVKRNSREWRQLVYIAELSRVALYWSVCCQDLRHHTLGIIVTIQPSTPEGKKSLKIILPNNALINALFSEDVSSTDTGETKLWACKRHFRKKEKTNTILPSNPCAFSLVCKQLECTSRITVSHPHQIVHLYTGTGVLLCISQNFLMRTTKINVRRRVNEKIGHTRNGTTIDKVH